MNDGKTPVETSDPGKGRIHFVAALIAIVFLSAGIVANLPYKYVEGSGVWRGVADAEEMSRSVTADDMPTMAGWPFKYSVQYESVGKREQRIWSPLRLSGNIFLIGFLIACVYGYICFRASHIAHGKNEKRVQLLDAGTALAVVLFPAAILGTEYYGAWQHKKLANQLGRSGNCYLAVWIPEILATRIPPGLQQSLLRIRSVDLISADANATALACKTNSLVTLTCRSSNVKAEHLLPLIENPHFRGLQISRQDLDSPLVEAIARLQNLNQLDLSRTNLNRDELLKLDQLALRKINLTNTKVKLSEIGKPSWSQTAEVVSLSRPTGGSKDSLEVDNWPNLESLRVYRPTTISNHETLKIRLANLPALTNASLDRNQKHDLELENLPLLSTFDEGLGFLQTILSSDARLPGNMWLTRFKASNTPSLKRFGCYARDLDHLSLESMNSLRTLELGNYEVSVMNGIHVAHTPLKNAQQWIDQLGERAGPSTLNLMGLQLQSADLSPLKNNRGIRHLNLIETGINFDHVKQLAGMSQLESLIIRDCDVEPESLAWILNEFPNLDELVINGNRLGTVDISEHKQLRKLRITKLTEPQTVSLVDVPLLRTELHLEQCPAQLEISNAKSMTGLSVNAPWPKHAKLQGMRDLDWFAVGGSNVTDDLVDEVLVCRNLDQLTLAYTSVSPSKLKQIGELKTLSTLSVPGNTLDPSVIAAWTTLKSLWDVNFDDNHISTGTLVWLSGINSLRRLSLNRVDLEEHASEKIGNLTQLSELQLADVAIEKNVLRPLLEAGNIESLNLSGWQLDDELMDWLVGASSLKMLTLHNCQLSSRQINQLMERKPGIFLDLGTQFDTLDPMIQQELEQRVLKLTIGSVQGWRYAVRKRIPAAAFRQSEDEQVTYRESDRIQINNFR